MRDLSRDVVTMSPHERIDRSMLQNLFGWLYTRLTSFRPPKFALRQ